MTNFFFGLMSILSVLYLIIILSTDNISNNKYKLKPYNGYIVTNKDDGFLVHNVATIRNDSTSHVFISEDIIFDSLKLGDTIKVK